MLARREGVGLHDAFLTGCRNAATGLHAKPHRHGAQLCGSRRGVVVDSVVTAESPLRFVPLAPAVMVPLVSVWQEQEDTPAVQRLRDLVAEWKMTEALWGG